MSNMHDKSDSRSGRIVGRWLLIAAALMWSTGGLFAKAPLFLSWSPETRGLTLAFWRTLFGGIVLLPFIVRIHWNWRFITLVAAFTLMNVTFLTAMSWSEATVVIWLQSTAPVWVFLTSVFWLHEPIRPRDWGMLGMCLAGVVTILTFELQGERLLGVSFGLLSGLFYAGVVLSLRQLRQYDAFWLVSLSHVATALLLAPIVLSFQSMPTFQQLLILAAFGVLQMGVPYVLFSRALRSIPSHEASCISLLEPVVFPLWVFVAWSQDPTYQPPAVWTLVGGGLILVGLLFRFLGRDGE